MIASVGYVVRYQKGGPDEKPQMAWVDPTKFPDPRAVLEAVLGPLVLFEVVPTEPEPSEPTE